MAYKDEILADSPRGYWRFDEISGDTSLLDLASVGALTPQPTNAIIDFPALHQGNRASCQFNGTTQYATRADQNQLDLADSFTLEAWIYLDAVGRWHTIVDKGANAYALAVNNSNRLVLRKSFIADIVASTITLSVSTAYHVAATKSGATVKLYINGADVTGTVTNQTCTDNSSALHVGREISYNYMQGRISDVALYSGALSAARIAAHYSSGLVHRAAANLIGGSSLASAAVRKQFPAALLTGVGSVEATPVKRLLAVTLMTGVGTIDAAAIRQPVAAASLTGVGTFSGSALRRQPAVAQLTGVATLTAETKGFFVGAAELLGEGFLSAGRQLVAIPPMPINLAPVLISAEGASERFSEALTRGYKICLVIQVLDGTNGQVLAELDTVETGAVTLDSSAAIRGRCDLTIVDDGLRDLIPTTPQDMLAPYGNEIRLARGIRYPDGTAEAVELGVFRMRQVNPEDSGASSTIQITGLDRWSRLTDARFEQTWVIPAGTNAVTAIRNTVLDAYPDCPLDLGTTNITLPQKLGERGGDRGTFVQDIAWSIGSELYFDGTGTLCRRPLAVATDNNRWTIREGEGGALLKVGRAWDAERVYNKVIVSGEPIDDALPVCATALDNNPQSPTYYYGKFGKRPRFYVSQMITTEQQAGLAAAGILAKSLGTSQQVTFDQMVDPTMEPGKVVRIMRERLGLDEKHVLDTLTIPLAARDSMPGRTRVTEVIGT